MELAIVSPFPPSITGIGQYGYHVSRALAQSGQFSRVTVLAGARAGLPRPMTPSLTRPAGRSFSVEYAWQPDQLSAGPAILSALQRLQPDLVWYNMGASVFGRSPLANLLGFLSLGWARWAGLPTVVTLHELVELADLKTLNAPGGRLAQLGARWLTGLATQADVVCFTMRRYVEWFAARRPAAACAHIPIGAYRAPLRLPEPDGPELLFFTTLAPYKGLEVLLAAYRSLLPRYPGLRLTIAGTEHPRFSGYAESLRRDFAHLPGICWLGQVPEERVRDVFAGAQIVVLPYIASTGSSSVLYQVATWGRALVASDLPETISVTAESGLEVELFRNRDTAGLASAIQSLLDSPQRRRDQVEHNFTVIRRSRPEETCRLYLQAFNRALAYHQRAERLEVPAVLPVEPA